MANQAHTHNYDAYGSNVDASNLGFFTNDGQFAREPTSDQWPTSNVPNAAAAAFSGTTGSFPLNTAPLFDFQNQAPESQQAAHYQGEAETYQAPDLQYPAHSQLLDTYVGRDDAPFQPTYPSQIQPTQYPFQREDRQTSRSLEGHRDQLNRDTLTQPTEALTSHGYDSSFLLHSDLEASEEMHQKRRSDRDDVRPEAEISMNPRLKRRRLEAQTKTGHPQAPDPPPLPSLLSPSQMPNPKTQTILACGLWALSQLTEKPTEELKVNLSCLCGEEDPSVIDTIFTASGPTDNGNTMPNMVREAGGELWKSMNPDVEPALWHKSMLSQVYGGSVNTWSSWFVRKRSSPANFDDSGHGTMTQTMTSIDHEILARWRCNSQKCRKKKPHGDLRRDPERKYFCTSLCGQTFDSVDNWKKHEGNNRMQKAYPCDVPTCRRDPGLCVWSRKDELEKHLKAHHQDQKDLHKARFLEIRANVRGNCLWRNCPTLFASFKEFLAHMPQHFNNEWTATDLRDLEEETDAPLNLQPGQSYNQDPDFQDSDDKDKGSPSPNAGAGPSSGHQAPPGYGPGSGSSGSGSKDSERNNSGTSRSGALGNKYAIELSDIMQLKDLSPPAQQTSQQMALWLPRLDFLGRLGSGATAVVDEVSIAGVSGTLACKTFAARWRLELFQEPQTMSRLRHPHIVALFHAYFQAGFISILMQPVADYNLSQYLAKNTFTTTEHYNMWLWFSCLTSGLHHMHEHGVLHHDIKPSNILVMNKQVFYSDFGSSASIADDQAHKFRRWGFTRIYAAPEVFHGDRRTASDIFSLGCVFLEMITVLFSKDVRQQLHWLQAESYQKDRSSLHWASTWNTKLWALSKHQMTGSKVRNLLQICQTMTDPHPDQRPSAAEIDKRLNPRLCRSCSYSTKWRGDKASTWLFDQSSLKSLRSLNMTGQKTAKAKESIPSRIEEHSQASHRLDQLGLEDASKSGAEKSLLETGKNKTVKEVRAQHKTEVMTSMMSKFLENEDRYEKFRACGIAALPKNFNAVGLPSQYPPSINI